MHCNHKIINNYHYNAIKIILITQVFVISKIESRVTPGRIKPSSGGVAISGSMYAKMLATEIDNSGQ